jgi:hypothetical protein
VREEVCGQQLKRLLQKEFRNLPLYYLMLVYFKCTRQSGGARYGKLRSADTAAHGLPNQESLAKKY